MKKPSSISLVLLLLAATSQSLWAQGTLSDVDLQKRVLVDSDNYTADDAIDHAAQAGNSVVLLGAINNRNWELREYAVQKMGTLPMDKAQSALLVVLNNDLLWAQFTKSGGELMISQEGFLHAVQGAVLKAFGVDASAYNCFKEDQRKALLAKLTP